MPYRRSTLTTCLLCLAALPLPAGAVAADEAAADSGAAPGTYVNAPVLVVEEPGRAPRRLLRYVVRPGLRRTVVLTSRVEGEVLSGESSPVRTKVPTIQATVDITVNTVDAQGDIQYGLVVTGAGAVIENDVAKSMADAARAAVARVKGLHGEITVTSRGLVKHVRFDMRETNPHVLQLLEGLRQVLIALSPVLPEEPVGPGARWEEIVHLRQNDAEVMQTASRELISLSGTSGRIGSKLQQSAGRQSIHQNGLAVELLSLTATGSEQVTFDLARLIPTSASISLSSQASMQLGAQPVQMKQTSRTELRASK